MLIDPKHLKFTEPVGIRAGGHVSHIHTVEDAIAWIDDQTDSTIIKAFKMAKEKLHEAARATELAWKIET